MRCSTSLSLRVRPRDSSTRCAARRLSSPSRACAPRPPRIAPSRSSPRTHRRVAVSANELQSTLLAGLVAGGGAYAAVQLNGPLPYMLGPLLATAAASLAGLPLSLPAGLRSVVQPVIGVALGAAFDASLWSRLAPLSETLACLLLSTAAATAVGTVLYALSGARGATAFYSAVPGGLNDMTLIGGEAGGDERAIALSHTVRLLCVVCLLPLALRGAAGAARTAAASASASLLPPLTLSDGLALLACGVLGPLAATFVKLPAAPLVGSLALSAFAHASGWTSATPPPGFVAAAQAVVGAVIGTRFAGYSVAKVSRAALVAAAVTAAQVATCLFFAAAAARLTGFAPALLLLAFSPGGITEMSLTATAVGLDAAFVATHHVARIVAITSLTPLVYTAAQRFKRK